MISRAIDTRSLSAYKQVILFHSLHVEKEPTVRDVKAPIWYQDLSGGLGLKCEKEKKLQEKCQHRSTLLIMSWFIKCGNC